MSAVDAAFARLKEQGRKALVPFVTAGDPSLEFTARVLRVLDRAGAGVIELGVPYSDPIADGPVIQSSYTRALAQGVRLRQIFDMLRQVTPELQAPVVLMTSYAICYRHGLERFVAEAREAGAAGAIVPDLLIEDADPMRQVCRRHDFSLVQLVTPTTPPERARQIAQASTGFLYYVSVTGITGERQRLPEQLARQVAQLRQHSPVPVCVGFGISAPEHVRLLAPAADGVIVGSAIVRRVAQAAQQPAEAVLQEVEAFVKSLADALAASAAQ